MSTTTQDTTAAAIEALQKELQTLRRDLGERIKALEARLGEAEQQIPEAEEEAVTPETIAVIAAAVTAFLGKKVRVRSARRIFPLGTSSWAQQGRAIVQASHNLFSR
jgi:hypothetical protein